MLDEKEIKRLSAEAQKYLIDLIRIDTSNPPGNETAACKYIKGILDGEGIDSEIIESEPERGSIVARLEGSGEKKPLLLGSHLDVVPAQAEDWSVPPFEGVVKDGCIWGRGAMDMKHTVAMYLAVFLELKRRGAPLKRDVIYCACADEEQSGFYGMHYLVENHYDLVDCEYALNEGGGYCLEIDGKRLYTVQNAEKGVEWMKLITRGEPGHGSVPRKDNSIVRMARALQEVARPLPVRKTKVAEQVIETMAGVLSFPKDLIVRQVFNPVFSEPVTKLVKSFNQRVADMLYALTHDTVSPTQINAGYKVNIIPEKCEAALDCRILPGQTAAGFRKMIEQKIDVDEVISYNLPVTDPTESPTNTDMYRSICKILKKHDPGCVISPFLMPGATDNRYFRKKGVVAYGFQPLKSETLELQEYIDGVHGIDEKIPIDGIDFGVSVLYDFLTDFCT